VRVAKFLGPLDGREYLTRIAARIMRCGVELAALRWDASHSRATYRR
jgi:hypothetical protein